MRIAFMQDIGEKLPAGLFFFKEQTDRYIKLFNIYPQDKALIKNLISFFRQF